MAKTTEKPILSAKKSDIEMVLVTPDMATNWIDNNKFENRHVSENNVQKIANDISSNQWRFDGNSLRFDKEGNLVDGQHRLWAIIRAQRSVLCMVVRNLEPGVVNVIDTGRSRTNGDILHFNGFVNSNALANACRLYLGFKEHRGDLLEWAVQRNRHSYSSTDLVRLAQDNKPLVNSNQALISSKFTKKFMGAGTAAFCHCIFSEVDKLQADEFFYLLEKGAELQEGHPVLALRNCLTLRDHLTSRLAKGGYYRSAYLVALVIKAWNAFREERNVKRLTYGEDKEKYPVAI